MMSLDLITQNFHGNTVSSKFFNPVLTLLSAKYHVITMGFLGCGNSDRLATWPEDLWFEWAKQAAALIQHLGYTDVNVIGCSGGALASLNLALENPKLVKYLVADSFEDLNANPDHHANLFADICDATDLAESHLFEHGGHPAMFSNLEEFVSLCDEFTGRV